MPPLLPGARGWASLPSTTPGVVLLRFKTTASAQALAQQQTKKPLVPGLELQRVVGRPRSSGPRGSSVAAVAALGASAVEHKDGIHVFRITDGSSINAKLKQLRGYAGRLAVPRPLHASCPASNRPPACLPRALPTWHLMQIRMTELLQNMSTWV